MSKEKGGRPIGMTKENMDIKRAYGEIKSLLKERKIKNMEAIALNELNYHLNRFGLSPFNEAKEAYQNTHITTGFEMAILGLYKKSADGDLNAVKLLIQLAGGLTTKVDHVSSDGSMSPGAAVASMSTDQLEKVQKVLSGPKSDQAD